MPRMVPNDGTSQLLPSHTSMGRDTVTQNLQHRARRLSLPFPHAIKQSFQRENNKKLNISLFPTHWQHFFTSLNAAALNGFLFANTYLLLPQNKSFLLQPSARRQQHFFYSMVVKGCSHLTLNTDILLGSLPGSLCHPGFRSICLSAESPF